MKRLILGLAVVAIGGGAWAIAEATSCLEPMVNATLVPLEGAPDGLCVHYAANSRKVWIYRCDEDVVFEDGVFE